MARRPRRRLALLAATLLVATTACGLASETTPREISDDEVGYDLLSPTTAPPTTLGDEIPTAEAVLYFADPEAEVVRPVRRDIPVPQNTSTLLRALFDARPTKLEASQGLINIITPQTRLLEVSSPDQCRVVIDLASYFPGLTAEEVSYAMAQIVFTLDEFIGRGVEVAILVEGLPEDVRTDDGRSVSAVTREDLEEFEVEASTSPGGGAGAVHGSTAAPAADGCERPPTTGP